MRPLSFYVVFNMGEVVAIVEGATAARALTPVRSYRPFKTRIDAEEFAMWWNHLGPDAYYATTNVATARAAALAALALEEERAQDALI